jgi:hypothetical protein
MNGIQSPEKILSFINRQYHNLRYGDSLLNTPSQRKKLHDFVRQDEFLVIILDSCRFDYFEQEVSSFIEGELQPVYTSATATKEYMRKTWNNGPYEFTYITGLSAPTDHAFERDGVEYRPSEHISKFVHTWNTCTNKELGAVPPGEITKTAIRQSDGRMIVHYVQPHAPYIGKYQLRDAQDTTWGESLQEIYEKIGRYDTSKKPSLTKT